MASSRGRTGAKNLAETPVIDWHGSGLLAKLGKLFAGFGCSERKVS